MTTTTTELFVNDVCQVCHHLKGDHEEFPDSPGVYTCDDACDEDLRGYCHVGRLQLTTYVAKVFIEVKINGEEEFDEAHRLVDEIMQRAWDTDQGRWQHANTWHYELDVLDVTAVADGSD